MIDAIALIGYGNQSFHLGDAFYSVSVLMASCVFVAGALTNAIREGEIRVCDVPLPLKIVFGSGLIYAVFQPYGFVVFLLLHFILAEVGRSGQAAMGIFLNIGAFIFFLFSLVPKSMIKQ